MTEILAQVFGVYALVAGFGLLIRPGWAKDILDSIENYAAMSYLMGAIVLMGGTAIILTHNIWPSMSEDFWPEIAITIIGWAAAIEGAIMLIYPPLLMGFSKKLVPNDIFIRLFALGTMIFGAALIWL